MLSVTNLWQAGENSNTIISIFHRQKDSKPKDVKTYISHLYIRNENFVFQFTTLNSTETTKNEVNLQKSTLKEML